MQEITGLADFHLCDSFSVENIARRIRTVFDKIPTEVRKAAITAASALYALALTEH